MTRNNLIFKILFAIELALLPMVIFAGMFLKEQPWILCIFIAAILLAKIWLHLFNDKTKASTVIISIGNILVFSVILIYFMISKRIEISLGVVALVFVVLNNIFRISLYNKSLSETIQAVDYCNTLFECLTLVALALLIFFEMLTSICLFALILTGVIACLYKIYYTLKYTDFIAKLKNLFRRN